MKSRAPAVVLILSTFACGLMGCRSTDQALIYDASREEVLREEILAAAAKMKPPEIPDPYAPKEHGLERVSFTDKPMTVYRFSEEQQARMARTKLDPQRLVAYLEKEWPVSRLQAYCVAKNRSPRGSQNFVAMNRVFEGELHAGKSHGFDIVWVYVDQDDGRGRYIESAGWDWHRWTCSLNVHRKRDHWEIIELLPNDFMDSPKYATRESDGAANPNQPLRPEANANSSAAESGR